LPWFELTQFRCLPTDENIRIFVFDTGAASDSGAQIRRPLFSCKLNSYESRGQGPALTQYDSPLSESRRDTFDTR
jgi:hypothetical protein